jgi:hypothetical protein
MNIDKLKKRLCIKDDCSGYLFESHDKYKNEILRCKECHGFVNRQDADIMILREDEYVSQDEVDNMEELNNL